MKRMVVVAVMFVLFGVCAETYAVQGNNNNCFADVDTGTMVCRAICRYPRECVLRSQLPDGSYCWASLLVNGGPGACHDGEYEPCCDPNFQW